MSLGSNGVEWVCLLRKIPTPLRCTNFYTSSALFAPSFVTQPKGHKCTQILWNAPKHLFRVQWGGSGAFVAKNFEANSWHKLMHQFGPFCTEFRNSTKRSQMHQNCTKHTKTWVQGPMGVDWLPWLRKIATRLRTTNFCSSSASFASSFVSQPNFPKCTKIVWKCTKTWV